MRTHLFIRLIIIVINLFVYSGALYARCGITPQETEDTGKATPQWEFYLVYESDKSLPVNEDYLFGNTAFQMKEKIQQMFVTREEIVPGDPITRTIIKKPSIYRSVITLEKHLKKEVKENRISVEKATEIFVNVERIALAAFDTFGTEKFEDELNRFRKNPNQLLSVFAKVKLILI